MKDINCRETFSSHLKRFILYLVGHAGYNPVLGIHLLTCLPAAISGCNPPDMFPASEVSETSLCLKSALEFRSGNYPVDILIYNNDRFGRLNTYQRIHSPGSGPLKVSSTTGDMLFTVLSNCRMESYEWADICSREAVGKMTACLEDEIRNHPFMSGECTGRTGSVINLRLSRKCAEIRLRKISCNFVGPAYSGCLIDNPKVYLINVNAETPVIGDEKNRTKRIINTGRLDMNDVRKFREADIICQELPSSIGIQPFDADVSLLCYPNHEDAESPGTPVTRLVIEGTVSGQTFFWSSSINNIEENCRYIYDICITRPGTSDPDIPIEPTYGEIIMETERWKEKEEYGVRF